MGNSITKFLNDLYDDLENASLNGDVERVRFHIDRGVDVNRSDDARRTPLYWACEEGHLEVVRPI